MGYFNSPSSTVDIEDKAGYNQAGKIVELLAMLRTTYIASKMENNFTTSLECCRGVLDIIAGKVPKEIIIQLDNFVYRIESDLPFAEETYINKENNYKFYKNTQKRRELKRKIESLWRSIEHYQDEYGYGMISEDESGL